MHLYDPSIMDGHACNINAVSMAERKPFWRLLFTVHVLQQILTYQ